MFRDDSPSPYGPIFASTTAHFLMVGLLVWISQAQFNEPTSLPASPSLAETSSIKVLELPATPQPKPLPEIEEPKVEPATQIAIEQSHPPKRVPPPQAEREKKPVPEVREVVEVEPKKTLHDPFKSKAQGSSSGPARGANAQADKDEGMSAAYSRLIAAAIHRQLGSSSDTPPTKGTLLALSVEPSTGRVLSARISRTSGSLSWDNRAQAAARQTVIPSNPAGTRASQFTVYIHP